MASRRRPTPIHRPVSLKVVPTERGRDPDDGSAVADLELPAAAVGPLQLGQDEILRGDDRCPTQAGVIDDCAALEGALRPGVAASEHQIDADDLDPMDEPADPSTAEVDRVVHEIVALEGGTQPLLVVGWSRVEDDIESPGRSVS